MSNTFSEYITDALQNIAELNIFVATDGTDTTVTDADYKIGAEKNGTLFVLDTTDGLAPKGEFQRIESVAGTVYTIDSALSDSIGEGDTIGIAATEFINPEIIRIANKALRALGDIPIVDKSLTSVDDQTEYALPDGAEYDLRGVYLQTDTENANNNRWSKIYNWKIEYNSAGNSWVLIFQDQPVSGRVIRLFYISPHPKLSSFDDIVNDAIHPELAEAQLVYEFRNVQTNERQNADPTSRDGFNKAASQLNEKMEKHRIKKPKKQGEILVARS